MDDRDNCTERTLSSTIPIRVCVYVCVYVCVCVSCLTIMYQSDVNQKLWQHVLTPSVPISFNSISLVRILPSDFIGSIELTLFWSFLIHINFFFSPSHSLNSISCYEIRHERSFVATSLWTTNPFLNPKHVTACLIQVPERKCLSVPYCFHSFEKVRIMDKTYYPLRGIECVYAIHTTYKTTAILYLAHPLSFTLIIFFFFHLICWLGGSPIWSYGRLLQVYVFSWRYSHSAVKWIEQEINNMWTDVQYTQWKAIYFHWVPSLNGSATARWWKGVWYTMHTRQEQKKKTNLLPDYGDGVWRI